MYAIYITNLATLFNFSTFEQFKDLLLKLLGREIYYFGICIFFNFVIKGTIDNKKDIYPQFRLDTVVQSIVSGTKSLVSGSFCLQGCLTSRGLIVCAKLW